MSVLRPHPERAGAWASAFVLSSAIHAAAGAYLFDLIPLDMAQERAPISFPDIAISNIMLQEQQLAALEPQPDTTRPPVEAETPEQTEPEDTPPVEEVETIAPEEPETLEPVTPDTPDPVEPEQAETLEPVSPEVTEQLEPVTPDVPQATALEPTTPTSPVLTPVLPDEGSSVLQGATVEPVQPELQPVQPTAQAVAVAPTVTETPQVAQTVTPAAPVITSATTVTRVAPVAPPPRDPPVVPTARPAPPPPSPEDLAVLELIDRIRTRFGDTCLIALPQNQGAGLDPLVTLMSDQERSMATFVNDVLSDPDLPVENRRVLMDSRQCPALDFARARPTYPTFRVDIALQSRLVASGERLTGRVGNVAGRFTTLLLIDANGVVQDLRNFTQLNQGGAVLDVPVNVAEEQRDTSQILMAIATPSRLQTVGTLNGRLAQDFFPALAAEVGDDVIIGILPFDVR